MDIKIILIALLVTIAFAIINETRNHIKSKRQTTKPTKDNTKDIATLLVATKLALIKAGILEQQIDCTTTHLSILLSDKLIVKFGFELINDKNAITLECANADDSKLDSEREDIKELKENLMHVAEALGMHLDVTIVLAIFASMVVKFNTKYTKTPGQIKDYML